MSSIDTIEYTFKNAFNNYFVGYKYKRIDFDVEKIEDFNIITLKKWLIFKFKQKVPYTVSIDTQYIINYVDVKEKIELMYGIDKIKKTIYWKCVNVTNY